MNTGKPVFEFPAGVARLGSAERQAARSRARARQVVLVPGAAVPVLTLDLPAGVRGTAREQVARRRVTDLVGQNAADLDIRPFHGPADTVTWSQVLVGDVAQMAAWRAAAGPDCRAVLPDYLALPAAGDLWTLAIEPEQVGARLVLDPAATATGSQ